MTFTQVLYLIVGIIFLLFVSVSIWYIIYNKKVTNMKQKAEEYLAVTDIALAVKQEFLMRLAKLIGFSEKEIPKNAKTTPQAIWPNAKRQLFVKDLNLWEEKQKDLLKKKKIFTKNKEVNDLLEKIEDTDQRINNYIFLYNDYVLKYNYELKSKQAMFFLKKIKFPEKEILYIRFKETIEE